MDTEAKVRQADFAALIDRDQSTVSRMLRDGLLPKGGTLRDWIRAYVSVLESEKEALAGSAGDDSAEARAARLALTMATTKLREQQTRMLVRDYEAACKQHLEHVLGEVQAVLYQKIPTAVVGRLLSIIQRQEDRYAAAAAFKEVVGEAVEEVLNRGFDSDGFARDNSDHEHDGDPAHEIDQAKPTRPMLPKTTKGKRT